jgi:hypothetical protein
MIELVKLGQTHFVELTTTLEPGVWNLSVTKRKGGYSARSYTGKLSEVVGRSVAEAGDVG